MWKTDEVLVSYSFVDLLFEFAQLLFSNELCYSEQLSLPLTRVVLQNDQYKKEAYALASVLNVSVWTNVMRRDSDGLRG